MILIKNAAWSDPDRIARLAIFARLTSALQRVSTDSRMVYGVIPLSLLRQGQSAYVNRVCGRSDHVHRLEEF
ncbi:MAG: hypothetical protein ACYC6Y_27350, partial [Thermoguttaceae bacterium]